MLGISASHRLHVSLNDTLSVETTPYRQLLLVGSCVPLPLLSDFKSSRLSPSAALGENIPVITDPSLYPASNTFLDLARTILTAKLP